MKKTSLLLMILALLGLGVACDREIEREEYQEEGILEERELGNEIDHGVQEMEENTEDMTEEMEEEATQFGDNVEETSEEIVE